MSLFAIYFAGWVVAFVVSLPDLIIDNRNRPTGSRATPEGIAFEAAFFSVMWPLLVLFAIGGFVVRLTEKAMRARR